MKLLISTLALALVGGLSVSACTEDSPQQASSTRREAATITTTTGSHEAAAKDARGFVGNIDSMTTDNRDFRRVIYTGKNLQLVLMALKPGEDIGREVHDVDQFFRVEAGTGEVVINDRRSPIRPDFAIVVPAGAEHNVINTGKDLLQVYTIYGPPQHRDGVVHHTKAEAERDTEHFDGKTSE